MTSSVNNHFTNLSIAGESFQKLLQGKYTFSETFAKWMDLQQFATRTLAYCTSAGLHYCITPFNPVEELIVTTINSLFITLFKQILTTKETYLYILQATIREEDPSFFSQTIKKVIPLALVVFLISIPHTGIHIQIKPLFPGCVKTHLFFPKLVLGEAIHQISPMIYHHFFDPKSPKTAQDVDDLDDKAIQFIHRRYDQYKKNLTSEATKALNHRFYTLDLSPLINNFKETLKLLFLKSVKGELEHQDFPPQLAISRVELPSNYDNLSINQFTWYLISMIDPDQSNGATWDVKTLKILSPLLEKHFNLDIKDLIPTPRVVRQLFGLSNDLPTPHDIVEEIEDSLDRANGIEETINLATNVITTPWQSSQEISQE